MDLTTEVDEYKDIISGHPHFNAAYKKLRKTIRHAVSGNMIFLFGPTGVGKSTLQKQLIKDVLNESSEETSADRSVLPIVRIELEHPNSKQFSWIEFYRNALNELQEPLIDKKFKNMSARSKIDLKEFHLDNRPTAYVLKAAFQNALSRRKTRIVLLDEAHHFGKGFPGELLFDQLESIKSMASMNKESIFVLAGTYELLRFLNRSGQLSRRGLDVHFPRYKAQKKEEKKQFITILKAFRKHSPLKWDDEILKDVDYLYAFSAGCVGILKEWIDRAHMEALEAEAETMTLEHLKEKQINIEKMNVITEEMVDGERLLEPKTGDLQKLQELLGLKVKSNDIQVADDYELLPAKPSAIPKPKRRNVGIRNAKRDPIGVKKDGIA